MHSTRLKNNQLSVVSEIEKISYVQCIIDTFNEFSTITSQINNDIQSIIYYADNKVKIIKDVEETMNKILFVLDDAQQNVSRARLRFLKNYHLWLNAYSDKNISISKISKIKLNKKKPDTLKTHHENIIEFENSNSSDPEIINEIRYVNIHEEFENVNGIKNTLVQGNEDIYHESTNHSEFIDNTQNKISETFESLNNHADGSITNGSLLMSDSDSTSQTNNYEDHINVQSKTNKYTNASIDSDIIEEFQNINNEDMCNKSNNYKKKIIDDNNEENTTKELVSSDFNKFVIQNVQKNSTIKSNNNTTKSNLKTNNKATPKICLNKKVESCKFKNLYLSDKKLQSECTVRIENLSKLIVNKNKNNLIESNSLTDKKFQRIIDLNILTKKNKRYYSSDTSSTSKSSISNKNEKIVRRSKKFKKNITESESSETEISSYYESSDNCDEENTDKYSNNLVIDLKTCNNNEEISIQRLLKSSDSSKNSDSDTDSKERTFTKKNKKIKKNRIKEKNCSDSSSSENEEIKNRSKWLKDKILNFKLDDLQDDRNKNNKNPKKKFTKVKNIIELVNVENQKLPKRSSHKRSNSDTDSDNYSTSNLSDSFVLKYPQVQSDNEISECSNVNNDIRTNAESINNHPKYIRKLLGRRNIRKILEDQQIAEDTKQAGKNEEIRFKRIMKHKNELQLLFNEEKLKSKYSLILDFNRKTKEFLRVDKGLVKYLKPHQEKGIRFMWDCCFETLEHCKTTEGSGCILAHCMGLGKTFQIITLAHTLLVNKITGINTIMIICPMNTIQNWIDEFDMWLKNVDNKTKINIYELTQTKKVSTRLAQLNSWHKYGGVLIISYDMFRFFLSCEKKLSVIQLEKMKLYLISPGADLVVCDEGHLLKNEVSLLVFKLQQLKTKRRIVLTGTPLQNNLSEYHCMVQFVKPNLLGTNMEFINRFNNPIINGQFDNSTPEDVKLMKHRAHVLHRMLKSCVQRCDYTVLRPFLPIKQEYVILIRLSELQSQMYKYYIENIANTNDKANSIFINYHEIKRLVAHPKTMALKAQIKTNLNYSESSQKLKNEQNNLNDFLKTNTTTDLWWSRFINEKHITDINTSYKLVILFSILEKCEKEGDKLLVFSQCLYVLKTIQKFLEKNEYNSEKNNRNKSLFNFQGEWKKGLDYFQLDGSVNSSKRTIMCKKFNNPDNKRARLFLISTKAGALGINLTGANRVVIFDPSWNPFNDVQSIFRVFRFGQKKPCYIYRFLTAGTMEQKIYNRQVTKLSLSLRVLDEQQIERHYRDTDLTDLYKFEPLSNDVPTLSIPRDHVLAYVFFKYKNCIYNFFEHDSLLENKEEEELDEDERKQAWLEYQQEKLEQQIDISYKSKVKVNQKKRLIGNE